MNVNNFLSALYKALPGLTEEFVLMIWSNLVNIANGKMDAALATYLPHKKASRLDWLVEFVLDSVNYLSGVDRMNFLNSVAKAGPGDMAMIIGARTAANPTGQSLLDGVAEFDRYGGVMSYTEKDAGFIAKLIDVLAKDGKGKLIIGTCDPVVVNSVQKLHSIGAVTGVSPIFEGLASITIDLPKVIALATDSGTLVPESVMALISEVPTAPAVDVPTDAATDAPTDVPTDAATDAPTDVPTDAATDAPTDVPTDAATDVPTDAATDAPTDVPTDAATDVPTDAATDAATEVDLGGPIVTNISDKVVVVDTRPHKSNTSTVPMHPGTIKRPRGRRSAAVIEAERKIADQWAAWCKSNGVNADMTVLEFAERYPGHECLKGFDLEKAKAAKVAKAPKAKAPKAKVAKAPKAKAKKKLTSLEDLVEIIDDPAQFYAAMQAQCGSDYSKIVNKLKKLSGGV